MNTPITVGSHHIGLTVSKLEESAAFFTKLLGWKELKRDEAYPSIFVSDGTIMLTLWTLKEKPFISFNRKSNVGLHHLALGVESEEALETIYKELNTNNIKIEFPPEFLRGGPAKHMICYEPSGIRIEFIWTGD